MISAVVSDKYIEMYVWNRKETQVICLRKIGQCVYIIWIQDECLNATLSLICTLFTKESLRVEHNGQWKYRLREANIYIHMHGQENEKKKKVKMCTSSR